jgi:3-oxoacyl-[acyl-carrier protein] reductase
MTTKTILVTGASKGIGRAIALRLARDGFTVVAHYHVDRQGAEATLAKIGDIGGLARSICFDAGDRASVKAVLEADMAAHGPYWGVVLNAGIARDIAFPAMEDKDWDEVMETNLGGFYNVLRPVVMPMVSARRGGRIVTLSSVSGLVGNRGQVNYSAARPMKWPEPWPFFVPVMRPISRVRSCRSMGAWFDAADRGYRHGRSHRLGQ